MMLPLALLPIVVQSEECSFEKTSSPSPVSRDLDPDIPPLLYNELVNADCEGKLIFLEQFLGLQKSKNVGFYSVSGCDPAADVYFVEVSTF